MHQSSNRSLDPDHSSFNVAGDEKKRLNTEAPFVAGTEMLVPIGAVYGSDGAWR
jgi:hypothetical protein